MAGDAAKRSLSDKLGAELRVRAISGSILAVAGVVALSVGGVVCALWIAAICAAMAWEWIGVTWADLETNFKTALVAMSAVAVVASYLVSPMLGLVIAFGLPALCLAMGRKRLAGARWTLLGLLILASAGVEFVWLRGEGFPGFLTALWLVMVVAATDIGGYFAGRLIGGPKLAPSISPKKTWSGALGGFALSAATGAIFSIAVGGGSAPTVALLSIFMSAAAIAGDLFESAAKRRFGVKDAGSLLPGHGGFCDRFDGLMTATLTLAIFAMLQDGDNVVW